MMHIEPSSLPWQDAYKLMIGSVLPRPIAFVSTMNQRGEANLAPFSFFTAICADPMLVCFAPMVRGTDGAKKDTISNIEETKQFVINIVGEHLVEPMNECAYEFAPEIDEFEQTGLTKIPSLLVTPPRVKESDIHLECILHELHHYGDWPGAGSLVIGKVVQFHVNEALYADGKIDVGKLRPIGRMAGQVYTKSVSDTFVLERRKRL